MISVGDLFNRLANALKAVHSRVMSTGSSILGVTSSLNPPVSSSSALEKWTAPAMSKARPRMGLVRVCRALGSPIRMRALRRLLEVGQPMSVSQLASKERLGRDAMSRHLQVMEQAGLLQSHSGVDRRCSCYFVPKEFQTQPGVLDFGCCTIQLNQA